MVGRPRKLSLDETLQRALQVFWQKGYASTSIGDLSEAIGVGPSSLYNSFGNKAGLYLRALAWYQERVGGELMAPLDAEAHIIDGLVGVLRAAVVQYTDPSCPGGCAVLAAGRVDDPEAGPTLIQMREASVAHVEAHLDRAAAQGQLASGTSTSALARFIVATLHGLSSQARDGVSLDELDGAIQLVEGTLERHRATGHEP